MARVKDPVCGMEVDSDTAAAKSTYQGETYYFCSTDCAQTFDANPSRYAARVADRGFEPEQHEPPFTKSGGFVAPKFGAAGSGGAEYEPLPEKHEDRDGA